MSFANLKKQGGNALAGLQAKVQAAANGESNRDPRMWKLSYNKDTKIGSATIRFLPFGGGERLPWAEWAEFSFKGKGGNYWERSLRSIGQDDPVAELNHLQWERNQGNDQDDVKKRGRRLRYVSNIVVVNDPTHPENNGKVFLFQYGPAIHKKIVAAMCPEYEDQAPVPVFDLWQGANFKVRTKDKSGYLNYDDSAFDAPSVLHQDDTLLEKWYNEMHDVAEFEAESNYKTYEELDTHMKKVLGPAYVAHIKGEEFDASAAAQAAAQGASPFGQNAQQSAQQPSNDPFAQAKQQSAQSNTGGQQANGDPFAQTNAQGGDSGQQGTSQADPFAQVNQQSSEPAQQGGGDPFAGMGSIADGSDTNVDDPFADLNI